MPLSEEEQRILQEMEESLREHDRDFVDRVSHGAERLQVSRAVRWSVVSFVAGTVLLLATFRTSVMLGAFGVIIMTVSALVFSQEIARQKSGRNERPDRPGPERPRVLPSPSAIADEWWSVRRRIRSRFRRR